MDEFAALEERLVFVGPERHGVQRVEGGAAVKAVIVPREGEEDQVSAEDVIGWARERMAAYKYPRHVEFVDSLPKSGSGKILWRVLQDREREKVA